MIAPVRSALFMIVALAALAGCDQASSAEDLDPARCDDGQPHYAVDRSTGLCWSFASPTCPPGDWPPCDGCEVDADCAPGEHCQAQLTLNDQPPAPTSGVCGPGMGTPLWDAGMLQPPPKSDPCTANGACAADEVCPAQYGRCSPHDPADALCPSYCEAACTDDTVCAAGQHCNAPDVCASAEATPVGVCAGWCE